MKKPIKIDRFNKKILSILHLELHLESDLTNAELAERVNLSVSACFQRVKMLKEAGYFRTFHADINLERVCDFVMAYLEFTLYDNSAKVRQDFEKTVLDIPEIMDCMKLSGDTDYISFCCFPDLNKLNEICDILSADERLSIKRITVKTVLDRPKFFLGYPLSNLKWLNEMVSEE